MNDLKLGNPRKSGVVFSAVFLLVMLSISGGFWMAHAFFSPRSQSITAEDLEVYQKAIFGDDIHPALRAAFYSRTGPGEAQYSTSWETHKAVNLSGFSFSALCMPASSSCDPDSPIEDCPLDFPMAEMTSLRFKGPAGEGVLYVYRSADHKQYCAVHLAE